MGSPARGSRCRDADKEVMAGVPSEPITVTVAYHVPPGRESEFRSRAMTVLGTAARVPGYRGGGVLAPGEVGTEGHVIHRFDSAVSPAAWEESAARTRPASYGDQLARETGHRRIRGLRAWFEARRRWLRRHRPGRRRNESCGS
ncbi:antibiotic biosynthesis monooxygenase [Streptomyces sp. NPDC059096]|uniref:antibiotic biosynthesis monooxygenase n=1 Tax=Streptomyces sp. NPDC059096 TaxID=3346727 RepID=UPI00367491B3